MMENMEGLCSSDVAMESLNALKKTQKRHQVLLEELNDLFYYAKAGVCEEEYNAMKMNEFN